MTTNNLTPEEQQAIQDELDYEYFWSDANVEAAYDAELQRYMRIYAGIEQEESAWQHQLSVAASMPMRVQQWNLNSSGSCFGNLQNQVKLALHSTWQALCFLPPKNRRKRTNPTIRGGTKLFPYV